MRRALILVIVAACGKGDGPVGGGSNAVESGPREAVLSSWKKAGLAPSPFTVAKDSPVGKDCASGTVNSVDVLVCNFASADDAKAAQDAGLQWVGDTTGIAQAKGTLLIAAADRKKADPTGATLNKLVKLAP